MKHIIFTLFLFNLNIPDCISQSFYHLGDSTGFDVTNYYNELNATANVLIDSLPEEFRDTFKVFSMSFYLHNSKYPNGVADVFNNAKNALDAEWPYYLLTGLELDPDGQNNILHIYMKFPENWLVNCFDDAFILSKKTAIKLKYLELSKSIVSESSFVEAQIEGMKYISDILGEISCCLPTRSPEECNGCFSALDVYNEMESRGFTAYCNCTISNPDIDVDQECLCNNLEGIINSHNRGNRSSDIFDLAEFDIEIANLEINLYEELIIANTKIDGLFGAITKNVTFCDVAAIEEFNDLYNTRDNSIWIHIWENPYDEYNNIIFIKSKLNSSDNDNSCNYLPFRKNTIQKTIISDFFQYTVSHRCFAPWDWFGDLFGISSSRNSFGGDNRGFSLKKFNPSVYTDREIDATARLHQIMTFNLRGDIVSKRHEAGETKGYYNFSKTIPANIDKPSQPAQIQFKTGVTYGDEEIINKISNGVNIKMNIQGANPLVTLINGIDWFTPDIENTVEMNVYYEPTESSIHLHGSVCTKSFPAHEVIIEDICGKRLFLNTKSCPCESEVGYELVDNSFDHHDYFDFRIPVDNNGCFLEEIYIMTVNRSIGTEADNDMNAVSEWNNIHLSKPPAVDCPTLPCEGCYKNNGEDLRAFYNCNGN